MTDEKQADGVTNYERLLREVAPLVREYEARFEEIEDSTEASICDRYRDRPTVGAMDTQTAVSWALGEMARLRSRLAVLEDAEKARGSWRQTVAS